MANKIDIMQSDLEIVVKEKPIKLSDEKLNSILLHTYEKAVKNVTKWHFYRLYSMFLSIAGTLLLTLLSSSFKNIGKISSDTINKIIIFITIVCALIGFICLIISINEKKNNDTEERDKTIKDVLEKYI